MVKSVVLACVMALASTAAFAAGTSAASKKSTSAPATPKAEGLCPNCGVPVAPKPQGFCPYGTYC